MITHNTPARLNELCHTLNATAQSLEETLRALAIEADAQLAVVCRSFLEIQSKTADGPPHLRLQADYVDAHAALAKASTAAVNIKDLLERAVTLNSKCNWWNGATSGKQVAGDVKHVCVQQRKESDKRWLAEHKAELPHDQWLAVFGEELVFHHPNRDAVSDRLAALELPVDYVLIAFIDSGRELAIKFISGK